jgi:hypothetical protein
MNLIKATLLPFSKVTLADLDKVRLMNRMDSKFCLPIARLPLLLDSIKNDYSVLEIDGETIFAYDNTYFDTDDNRMFINHQNGKRNRFKIRVRKYVQSDINFLEIKFKNNKGRTIKERIEREDFDSRFSPEELVFIGQSSPYTGQQLEPKLRSSFNRFTLVDHQFSERVTVDLYPGFKNREKTIVLENLVIIEVKQSKTAHPALITRALQANKVFSQGFSKYCIGRSLLEDNIKKNNFKPLLLKIRKEYYN